MRRGIGFGFQNQDLNERPQIPRQLHDKARGEVATEGFAGVLTELQQRVVDWRGHSVEKFGRLLQYDPAVDVAMTDRKTCEWGTPQ